MKKFIFAIFLSFSTILGFSQVFTSGTINATILDDATEHCWTIPVVGVGVIDGTYGLESVEIRITHTYDGDLDVYLVAPDATRIELTTDNGSSGNDYYTTTFDMTAATNVTSGTAPFNGSYIPEENLGAANNGQNADANWQLCITDDAGGDIGILVRWQLLFSNTPAPPPPPGTGNDCSTAQDLAALTSPYNATTTGYNNDFSFCTMGSSADRIFYIDVPNACNIEIWQSSNTYDSRHTMRYGGPCPGTTEIDCIDDIDTDPISWTNTTGSTQRVWWINAGYSSNEGDFVLEWLLSCCAPPSTVTASSSTTLAGPGDNVIFDYDSHTGGACASGNWEYQWEDGIGTVLQAWSTTSSYSEIMGGVGSYDYYLYMRCSACPSTTTQSNLITVDVENCMTCANAPVISLPYTFTGSTCGACDNYSSADACGSSYLNGDDYVFEYTPSSNEVVDVSLTTDATWVGVIVTEGCPDVGTCVVAITNSGANAIGSATLTAGTTYYFTVSTYPSPQCINNFTLNITSQCSPIFTLSDGGNNCPLEEFYIDVDITSLSGATSVMITNDGGAPAITGITTTGIQTIGSFPANTTVNVTVEDEATPACADIAPYVILECPSCTDGIQNQGETGVDCGGPCPPCPPIIIPTACTDTTHVLPSLGSVTFYDDGGQGGDPCSDGVAGNFCNCDCFTIVTICGAPGEYIIANFREFAMFNTNSGFDWMVIYDNNTTSGTILFDNRASGSKNGEPPLFTSNCTFTGPDNPLGDCNYTGQLSHLCSSGNCLTFQFWGTSVVNREGWDCLVNSVSVPCVLPVELTKFEYSCLDENTIKLEWTTATETNNHYFTIERSTDAVNFEKVVDIDANGNSNSEIHYEYIDNIETGLNYYYRLSQTDFDGKQETFDLLYVNCKNAEITIGPNPSIVGQAITIYGEYDNIIIKDVLGRIVDTKIVNNQILGLDRGVYIIEIDGLKTKIIVE